MVVAGDNRLAVLANEIVTAVAEMKASAEVVAERALQIGQALIEVKATLPHGRWEAWLDENVSMSARSARRYMQLATSGMKTATVADLGIKAAATSIAARRPAPAHRNALAAELAELLVQGLSDHQVDRVASWAEWAAERYPDASVAEAMAKEVSMAWLSKKWAQAQDPARRKFIEFIRDSKPMEAA